MWTSLPVQKYMCLDQKEVGKREWGEMRKLLFHPPSDLGTCTSEQGERSTFTHKDTHIVHPSGPDEEQLPHFPLLSFHPPSDLGTCTFEQGDRSVEFAIASSHKVLFLAQ